MSPTVRKAAALAIPKCWRLDPSTSPQLTEYLSQLLGDRQNFVAGAAVIAFMEVCPDRIDLVHKHYRGLVRKLVDMDEWAQLATLRLVTSYARRCFPQRTRRVKRSDGLTSKAFYEDEGGLNTDENTEEGEVEEEVAIEDPDLELLLKSTQPLLQSRNSAVIIAVTRLYLYLTPPNSTYLPTAVGPLISLLRSPLDIQQIALSSIVQVALTHPSLFIRYTTHFLLHSTDPPQTHRLKLEALTLLFPHCPPHLQSLILTELSHFSSSSTASPSLIRDSVGAIGRCAQSSSPATSSRCLRLLLAQISNNNNNELVVAESLTVIRHLIQANPVSHARTVIRLAKNLDTTTNPQARASIIWLVGEFAAGAEDGVGPDVLRILAKGFADEAEEAKLQIVLLAAKVYLHHLNSLQQQHQPSNTPPPQDTAYESSSPPPLSDPATATIPTDPDPEDTHPIPLLWTYILHLTHYDPSYPLRDLTRLYTALLPVPTTSTSTTTPSTSTRLATLLLLAPKPVPTTPSPSASRQHFTLGSSSAAVGGPDERLRGYEALPEWVQAGREVDASVRDEGGTVGPKEYDAERVVTAGERLDAGAQGFTGGGGKKGVANGGGGGGGGRGRGEKSLDDWLAEEEEEKGDGEDDGEGSDGETGSESDEGEDENEKESDDGSEESTTTEEEVDEEDESEESDGGGVGAGHGEKE